MKKIFIITFGILFHVLTTNAQVGINTTEPKASLDIQAQNLDGTTAEGLIVPRLTLAQLKGKDPKYGADQTGALVYVTNVTGGTTTKTARVTDIGYYSFNGTIWIGMTPDQSLRFFYMPSIVLPLSTTDPAHQNGIFTIDLHAEHAKQFGLTDNTSSKASADIADARITPLPTSSFHYLVTYYDNTVFTDVKVATDGKLKYKLINDGANISDKTFMNIIFKLK